VQIFTVLENSFFFPASILIMHPVRRVVFGKFLWIQSVLESLRAKSYNQAIGNVLLIEPIIEASKELQRIKSGKGWFLSEWAFPVFGKIPAK